MWNTCDTTKLCVGYRWNSWQVLLLPRSDRYNKCNYTYSDFHLQTLWCLLYLHGLSIDYSVSFRALKRFNHSPQILVSKHLAWLLLGYWWTRKKHHSRSVNKTKWLAVLISARQSIIVVYQYMYIHTYFPECLSSRALSSALVLLGLLQPWSSGF